MFAINYEANTKARAAMRAEIEAGGQAWRQDIGERYGAFQLELWERDHATLAKHKANPAVATEQGLAYISEQEAKLSERHHMAVGYASGAVLLQDPVDAEVTLRLYIQAKGAAIEPDGTLGK